jgi:chromosome segregation ATPase
MDTFTNTTPADWRELRLALASLEEQLRSLYAERQAEGATPGGSDSDAAATIESMEAQLKSLYEERQHQAAAGDTELQDRADSFEAQLREIYSERQETGDIETSLRGLETQLADIYAERATSTGSVAQLEAAVLSLESQVRALLEERNDLLNSLAGHGAQVDRAKERMISLVAQLIESEFSHA